MKKLSALAFRYIKHNFHRTLTTIVGVMLSAMMVYAVFGGGLSIYYNQAYDDYIGSMGWDAVYICDGETAREILALAPYYGESSSVDQSGFSVTNAWIMTSYVDKDVSAGWVAVNDFSAMPERFHMVRGVLPENNNEIILSQWTSRNMSVDVGDSWTFYYNMNPYGEEMKREDIVTENKKICGIFRDDYMFDDMPDGWTGDNPYGWAYTLMDEEMYNSETLNVYVRFDSFNHLEKQAENLAEAFSISDYMISPQALECTMGAESDVGFQAGILLIAFIIECVTLFIIRNAFNISVYERSNDYGILRCIGMSRGQIIKIILCEAICIAIIGGIFGILLGHVVMMGVFGIMKRISLISGTMKMHFFWRSVLLAMLIVLVGTGYAMVSPIEKLYKLNPIVALRKQEMVKERKAKPNRGRLLTRLFGFEVGYAYKTVMRSKGRFMVSVVTLALGTALFVSINSISSMTIEPLQSEMANKGIGTLILNTDEYEEVKKIRNDLNKMEAVKHAEIFSLDMLFYSDENGNTQEKEVYIGLEEDVFEKFEKQKDVIEERNFRRRTLFVSAERLEEILPETFPEFDYGYWEEEGKIYVYSIGEMFERINIDNLPDNTMHTSEMLCAAVDIDYTKSLNTFDRYCISSGIYFDGLDDMVEIQETKVVMAVVNSMLVLLMIIFITNLINTERSQIMVRREELSILRIIGIGKKQLTKMLYAETTITSIAAWLFGSVLGILVSTGWYYYFYVLAGGGEFKLFIDFASILISAIILLVAAVLTVLIGREEE